MYVEACLEADVSLLQQHTIRRTPTLQGLRPLCIAQKSTDVRSVSLPLHYHPFQLAFVLSAKYARLSAVGRNSHCILLLTCFARRRAGPGGGAGGVLLGILDGGVQPDSLNPDLISDQKKF